VVGDDNASHGTKSVTAGSVWATGTGFFGRGDGLTNLREYDTNALAAIAAHAGLSAGVHGVKNSRYVSLTGAHVSPYATWATAAPISRQWLTWRWKGRPYGSQTASMRPGDRPWGMGVQ
jgi:hypothetical protein